MRQIKPFSDTRLDNMCSYCGESPDTRDHVPSRILLEEPYPENLPVVPCCDKCNQGFSLDEEYIACLLECVLCGTTDIEKLQRKKIKRILQNKEPLRQKILQSKVEIEGQVAFNIEADRMQNVLIKLAKGHAKYENSEPVFEEPMSIGFKPLLTMTQNEIDTFLAGTEITKTPEVGSRAMQNFLIDSNNNTYSHWTIVQPEIYSYSVSITPSRLSVKIILWNYLAAEVIW
ncbi:hypothetical protein I5907_00015 [Panacibacter sp. DH6]|uniref:HNH endonuclease n=1 Tax=Panacibacter microcysteis TaxID=2793269 RepID=A0A931DXA1_9BACT|nr:hypothetical protein [Panacibacter microcysteis]MBG9374602.1 hypothetical protein [Panacibacter microcysteis]